MKGWRAEERKERMKGAEDKWKRGLREQERTKDGGGKGRIKEQVPQGNNDASRLIY